METRLRIMIPAIQVTLLIVGLILHYIILRNFLSIADPSLTMFYGEFPLQVLFKLNLPLVFVWAPILFSLARTLPHNFSGAGLAPALAINIAILLTVAAFWHFFVAEIQYRNDGKSLIRSSNKGVELLKAVIFCCIGVAAIVFAYWDGHRIISYGQMISYRPSIYPVSLVEAAVGGVILLMWAAVLFAIAVQDIRVAFGK